MRTRLLPVLLAGAALAAFLPVEAMAQSTTLSERMAELRREHAQRRLDAQHRGRRMAMLQALVYTDVTVRFEDTPVKEALEYLRTVMDVNMIVRYHDDTLGIGIDPETPITLEADGMTAIEVLDLVLEQVSDIDECTWQLRKSYIEVGPKERLGAPAAQEMRVYPIDNLLNEPPRFGNAPLVGVGFGYPGWVGGYDSDASTRGQYRYPAGYGGYYGGTGGGGYSGGFGPTLTTTTSSTGQGDDASINSREAKAKRAEELIDFVVSMVEPDAWLRNGGYWASIQERDGSLFIKAPEFIHRQLAGYPPIPPPKPATAPPAETTRPASRHPRAPAGGGN